MADDGTVSKTYTVPELAAQLRSRPGGDAYADLPDDVFVQRFIERNPQYSDIIKSDTSKTSGKVETPRSNDSSLNPASGNAGTTATPLGFLGRLVKSLPTPQRQPGTSYQAMDPAAAAKENQQESQQMTDEVGNMVPDSVTPALSYFQKHINDPLNKMGESGSAAVKGFLDKAAVRGALEAKGPVDGTDYPDALSSQPLDANQQSLLAEQEKKYPATTGITSAVGDVVGSTVSDPRNWPLFLMGGSEVRPIFQRLISAGFSAQMGTDTAKSAKNLVQNWDKLTPEQRYEQATSTGLTGIMSAMAGAHAALGGDTGVAPTDELTGETTTPSATSAAAPSPDAEVTAPSSHAQSGQAAPETHGLGPDAGTEAPAPSIDRPGPGAQTRSSVDEVGMSPIKILTDWLPNATSPEQSPLERIQSLQGAVQAKLGYIHNDLLRNLNNSEASILGLWDSYRQPPPWTDFDKAIGDWQGARQYSSFQLQRFTDELKNSMPDPIRREAISNYLQAGGDESVLSQRAMDSKPQFRRGYQTALKLSPDEKIVANNIRGYLDAQLEEAKRAGLLEQGVQQYVSQIWKKSTEQQARLQAMNAASELLAKPFFTKERLFRDYFEGEQKGFQPANKDVGFLLSTYEQSFGKALADRGLIKQLMNAKASDGRPLVQVSGVGRTLSESELSPETKAHLILPHAKGENAADYIAVDSPAMRRYKWVAKDSEGKDIFLEGDALAHPEIAKKLKNVLTPSAIQNSKLGRAALRLSSEFKSTLLSLSAFHQVQLAVHGGEHLVNPFHLPKINLENPRQMSLVNHGLMIASFNSREAFSEGLSSSGMVNKLPIIGKKMAAYQDYLFKDYLPRLKMSMAEHALTRNIMRYSAKLSRDQILRLTAEQANAAFGHLNYAQLGRNKTLQDVLRLTLLAPDFLEARGRFVAQALKPYGREQARALATGAAVMYVGARVLNQILNGDSYSNDPKMAFSVRVKNRSYSLRTVQGDILQLITNPREFVEHRLNPVTTRPLLEAVTGRDTFGRPRNATGQVQDFAKNVMPIPLQSLTRPADIDPSGAIGKSLGLTADRYRSPAARRAHDFVVKGATFTESSRSPEEQQLMQRYRSQMDAGKFSVDALRNDYRAGKITESDARQLLSESKTPQFVRDFKRLPIEKALSVWDVANDDERRQLRPILAAKAKRQLPNRVPSERGPLQQKVRQALGQGSTPAPLITRMLSAARQSSQRVQ
jgi:hypothetical protein